LIANGFRPGKPLLAVLRAKAVGPNARRPCLEALKVVDPDWFTANTPPPPKPPPGVSAAERRRIAELTKELSDVLRGGKVLYYADGDGDWAELRFAGVCYILTGGNKASGIDEPPLAIADENALVDKLSYGRAKTDGQAAIRALEGALRGLFHR
jgi:hypothetical protein